MKKVLAIFAHPDDEIIWGWHALQDPNLERHLIIVSDNHTGYGGRARAALEEVSTTIGTQSTICMNWPSEFYRLPTRYDSLTLPMLTCQLVETIKTCVNKIKPEHIVTHNPFGEYGHGDHRYVFNIVSSFIEHQSIRYADACQSNKCHLSFDKIPYPIGRAYFSSHRYVSSHTLNKEWFNPLKEIYKKHRAWSWGSPHVVPEKVGVYVL